MILSCWSAHVLRHPGRRRRTQEMPSGCCILLPAELLVLLHRSKGQGAGWKNLTSHAETSPHSGSALSPAIGGSSG